MARVRLAEHVPWTSLAPSADVTADRIEISRTGSTVRLRASNVTTLASAGKVCTIPVALRPPIDVRVPIWDGTTWRDGTAFTSGGFWGPSPRGWTIASIDVSWGL